MNLDRHCARCGKPEWTEEQREQVQLDLLLHDGQPTELHWPENWLHDIAGEAACWDCLTLEQRRREDCQCERCGAQFHDDGSESDRGWITPAFGPVDRLLCPDCQTIEEQEADTAHLLDMVERGERICAAEGRDYPADLARMTEGAHLRLWLRKQEVESFDQRLGRDA